MANLALKQQMNRTVRVNRLKLLEILQENRKKHIAEFNKAMDGYKAEALKEIELSFEKAKKTLKLQKKVITEHINKFSPQTVKDYSDTITIVQSVNVYLKVPVSYEDAYNAAISMATYDTREELDLAGAEFNCFVRDVWDWSQDFELTKSLYGATR